MRTPTIDLSQPTIRGEIVLRAGNLADPNALRSLKIAYERADPLYPDTIGLSVLFRPGATVDDLAREGSFRHAKLGHALVRQLIQALAQVGYDLILFVTPHPELPIPLPDHHSLAVARNGQVEPKLADVAADALLHALTMMDNPYQTKP